LTYINSRLRLIVIGYFKAAGSKLHLSFT
jgi:hypothetical protein